MSRFLLSFLLAITTSTTALAGQPFAQPPVERAGAPLHFQVIDRGAVRAKLAANRAANLARFRAYVRLGVFPNNTYTPGLLNVWRDEAGHYCAAATIIQASGKAELVAQVGRDNNFIRLADVTDGPLMDWMLTSGLTQSELVAIQKPFGGVARPVDPLDPRKPSIDDMLGGPVVVDTDKRAAETARLLKLYRQVDAAIVKSQRASLELAVDRLMEHPSLAAALLAG